MGFRVLVSLPMLVATLVVGDVAFAQGMGAQSADPVSVKRGTYLFAAAGCAACHTAKGGKLLAGGRALKTPFGTFYSPNITSDPLYGIGRWTEANFKRALRDGVGPHGKHYFPVFPYPSFTGMTDEDIRDLFAYLKTIPAVAQPNKPHAIRFPFGFRPLMVVWNWLFLKRGPFKPDPGRSAQLDRGAYLVKALGHCGECHTRRNMLGALDWNQVLAGTEQGPEGDPVPNLTSDQETGLGKWSEKDITFLLETGLKPDGDDVGDGMGEVVDASTSKLTAEDRAAIATYLKSVPPIRHRVRKSKSSS